jgi:Flp pilus assembly protein TadG
MIKSIKSSVFGLAPFLHRRRRSANGTIEIVLVLPVLLAFSFGLVEFGQYMFIKHCFESAARDATRVAIMPTATQSSVTSVLTTTLAQANVPYSSSWLTITDLGPSQTGNVSDVSTVPMGDELQLTLSATYSSIPNAVRPLYSSTGFGIGTAKTVVGECTMVKE